MAGEVGILNVGAGDTKLSFDPKNPQDRIRAARIVRDMLRRGFALLVEVKQPDGSMAFQRAIDFDDQHYEYIIADFDSAAASRADQAEAADEEASQATAAAAAPAGAKTDAPKPGNGRRTRRVPAASTRSVAVGRSAGG